MLLYAISKTLKSNLTCVYVSCAKGYTSCEHLTKKTFDAIDIRQETDKHQGPHSILVDQ